MIRSSATAIEVNGLHVILLLLVPILLTAITLLGLRLQQTTMRKILLWSPAVVLLGFCFVAIASIGMIKSIMMYYTLRLPTRTAFDWGSYARAEVWSPT